MLEQHEYNIQQLLNKSTIPCQMNTNNNTHTYIQHKQTNHLSHTHRDVAAINAWMQLFCMVAWNAKCPKGNKNKIAWLSCSSWTLIPWSSPCLCLWPFPCLCPCCPCCPCCPWPYLLPLPLLLHWWHSWNSGQFLEDLQICVILALHTQYIQHPHANKHWYLHHTQYLHPDGQPASTLTLHPITLPLLPWQWMLPSPWACPGAIPLPLHEPEQENSYTKNTQQNINIFPLWQWH